MGGCQAGCFIKIKNYKGEIIFQEKTPRNQETQIDFQKKEFPDMEEWEGERYKGIGIKKMKGYKCDLPIDKLNQKREEFWGARNAYNNSNYKMWRIINHSYRKIYHLNHYIEIYLTLVKIIYKQYLK